MGDGGEREQCGGKEGYREGDYGIRGECEGEGRSVGRVRVRRYREYTWRNSGKHRLSLATYVGRLQSRQMNQVPTGMVYQARLRHLPPPLRDCAACVR